jgi:pimeloyl-ACP methyl ester carboxylesterase
VLSQPKPNTLTPDNIVADVLAVADAVGAERFAYYGYSWLAVVGLQLALRTDRLLALAMGGYPPLDGPYAEMLGVTMATHNLAVNPKAQAAAVYDENDIWDVPVTLPPAQTQQFVTLYEALRGFDDRAIQSRLTCPRLCFAGSADAIQYGEKWGNLRVDIAGPIQRNKAELERLGWEVHVLEGLDHVQGMQAPNVLPILRPWLIKALLS